MLKIIYVDVAGAEHVAEVSEGTSVMRAAKDNGIDGIDADCGGVCACATCHVYVDDAWYPKVGAPSADEEDMLDCVNDRGETSRLSCQIEMRPELDGLIVRLPESQR
ncbi:2Fe-2S iron-sulfur cluster-binding protein [Sphingosinithalassobacter portus]|uniref:2Fe-2S iron-sulfur cluster-binding protein n=1 Tax=Stakelama portus TaxID=2676234 RepID=UPI000D6E9041|nr:2Fe-2S iron-sulfur cluster-binding protein [Sphingosinithalassobacter portus]